MLTNELADRAESIRELMTGSDAAHKESVRKAMEAGERLIEDKEGCKHGDWLPFLERAGVNERKAQRYMKIASSNLESDTVSDLGIGGALRFLQLRERASRHLQEAYDDTIGGGFGIEQLDRATEILEAMVHLFPEEQSGTEAT
jgi:hypothetical protein